MSSGVSPYDGETGAFLRRIGILQAFKKIAIEKQKKLFCQIKQVILPDKTSHFTQQNSPFCLAILQKFLLRFATESDRRADQAHKRPKGALPPSPGLRPGLGDSWPFRPPVSTGISSPINPPTPPYALYAQQENATAPLHMPKAPSTLRSSLTQRDSALTRPTGPYTCRRHLPRRLCRPSTLRSVKKC